MLDKSKTANEWFGVIVASIEKLIPALEVQGESELAYLAMTAKVELPFRDKLAFILHQSLQNHYHVVREWTAKGTKRIDIGICKNETAQCLIELKATNTQNGNGGVIPGDLTRSRLNHVKSHIDSLISDFKKPIGDIPLLGIFIAAHPLDLIRVDGKVPIEVSGNYKIPRETVSPDHMKKIYYQTFDESLESKKRFIFNIGKFRQISVQLLVDVLIGK